MNGEERGYFFALPRLLARLLGQKPREVEFTRWEIYGAGSFVFAFACVVAGRALLPLVRPTVLRIVVFFLVPLVVWIALLAFYFVNWLLAAALRKTGLYSAKTNNP